MKKNILITGGAGFVGSNLALFLRSKLKDHRIVCFDNLIRKGSKLNVLRLKESGIDFIQGDIRNKTELMKLERISGIVECSADPSVLAAYNDPNYSIETNLFGTVNCLELARRDKSFFIFLSTSRIYPMGQLEALPFEEQASRYDWPQHVKGQGFSYEGIEHTFPLFGARSLYGATKLSSELIALEYFHMFGIKGIINRSGVIAGPWQMGKMDQGIVGFWLACHKYGKSLSYIGYGGEGKQVRDIIHVDDICELILYEINHMNNMTGLTVNVGGGRTNAISLCELTNRIQQITRKKMRINSIQETRPSDIRIYITDNRYLNKIIGWSPDKGIDDILTDMNIWMDANFDRLSPIFARTSDDTGITNSRNLIKEEASCAR